MDLSDLQRTNSTESLSSDISDVSPMIIPFKRDIFLSTYRRQRFSLTDPIMHYIAKNPKNSKIYQKMVQSCKYFFIKNPIFITFELHYDDGKWKTLVNKTWKSIDMNTILAKVWITDELEVWISDELDDNLGSGSPVVSSIIPKIYQCDVKGLFLTTELISLNELMFLCSPETNLEFSSPVKNDDGTVVLFENVIEQLPNVKGITYFFDTPPNNTSKNTFKELWKIPHLSNYRIFRLYIIPKDFDIDSFYSFMKKNQNTRVCLEFSDQISEEYKARLEAIIDEIIATENHEYKPPYIEFRGLDREKSSKLFDISSG